MPALGYIPKDSTHIPPDAAPKVEASDEASTGTRTATDDGASAVPEDSQIAALEKRFHDRLGVAIRPVCYAYLLSRPLLFARVDWHNTPGRRWVGVLHFMFFPLIAALFYVVFRLSRAGVAAATARLRAELAFADALLASAPGTPVAVVQAELEACRARGGVADAAPSTTGTRRRFLLGGSAPTAADLTLASLAAPALGLCHLQGYGGGACWLPPLPDMPAGFQELAGGLLARPSGQLVARMYAEHRGSVV
jgi:hypothetical protein